MFEWLTAGLKRLRTLLYMLPVRKKVKYGKGLHIGRHTRLWAPNRIDLGNNIYIGKEVSIECDATIGDFCLIANRVAFVGRLDHNFRKIGVPVRFSPWIGGVQDGNNMKVMIEPDVWIGYGVIVLTGVTVGRGSIVAAGSVVTKDLPAYSIAAGVPAKVIGSRFDNSQIQEHEYRIQHGRFEFSERGYDNWVVEPYEGNIHGASQDN